MTNELRRQAYLEAMGVESYLPRLLLPGARPSVLCELPDWASVSVQSAGQAPAGEPVAAAPAAPVSQGATAPAGRSGAADIQQLLDGADVPKRAQRVASGVAVTQQRAAAEVPHFSLSLVRAGRVLLVDDGLSGEVDPRAYLQLVHNLLFALGVAARELSLDVFSWPLTRVRGHVDQSQTAAREALTAYLAKQLELCGGSYLLLMGETAGSYVLNDATLGDAPGDGRRGNVLLPHPQLPARCLLTASAARALNDAMLKPLIWRDIQPLAAALKSH